MAELAEKVFWSIRLFNQGATAKCYQRQEWQKQKQTPATTSGQWPERMDTGHGPVHGHQCSQQTPARECKSLTGDDHSNFSICIPFPVNDKVCDWFLFFEYSNKQMSPISFQITPLENQQPLIVLINPKSGGRQGLRYVRAGPGLIAAIDWTVLQDITKVPVLTESTSSVQHCTQGTIPSFEFLQGHCQHSSARLRWRWYCGLDTGHHRQNELLPHPAHCHPATGHRQRFGQMLEMGPRLRQREFEQNHEQSWTLGHCFAGPMENWYKQQREWREGRSHSEQYFQQLLQHWSGNCPINSFPSLPFNSLSNAGCLHCNQIPFGTGKASGKVQQQNEE